MQIEDNHKRQARAVIMKHFETSFSHLRFSMDNPPRYTVVVERPDALGGDTVFNVYAGTNFVPGPAGARFILDEMDEYQLVANIAFRLRDTVEVVTMNPEGIKRDVAAHKITARVTWQEVDGTLDTIILTKRLAAIHD
jgi:hypothetical protein